MLWFLFAVVCVIVVVAVDAVVVLAVFAAVVVAVDVFVIAVDAFLFIVSLIYFFSCIQFHLFHFISTVMNEMCFSRNENKLDVFIVKIHNFIQFSMYI